MKIIAIPEKMQKVYGFGTMLHPDQEMIEVMIKEIPFGKISTVHLLCQKLARDHDTNVTCPLRTGNMVKTIMNISFDDNSSIPFWRVIRKNNMLINSPFTAICAEHLKREGFQLSQNNKGEYRVENAKDHLFTFS